MGGYVTGVAMRLGVALQHILDCAEVELLDAGRTVPHRSHIAPGLPAFDQFDPCRDMLYVRVIHGWPSQTLPQKFLDIRTCGVPLVMQIGLGIVRCQSGVGKLDSRTVPSDDDLTGDALGLICDEGALFRALACCYPNVDGAEELIVDEWTQFDPSGGLVGGEITGWIVSDLTCGTNSP